MDTQTILAIIGEMELERRTLVARIQQLEQLLAERDQAEEVKDDGDVRG